MKQEKFLSKRLANPSRYNSSISSSSTSSSSTMSSLSSINTNRTHSLDHSYGMDNDDLTLEHTIQAPTRNKVVSIHNHHINRNQNRRVCFFVALPFSVLHLCVLILNFNYLFFFYFKIRSWLICRTLPILQPWRIRPNRVPLSHWTPTIKSCLFEHNHHHRIHYI